MCERDRVCVYVGVYLLHPVSRYGYIRAIQCGKLLTRPNTERRGKTEKGQKNTRKQKNKREKKEQ